MKELKNVVIYTKDHCPFSKRVLGYLNSTGAEFTRIRVDDSPELYEELKKKTNHQTVPQIFVNEEFIGGAKELFEWIEPSCGHYPKFD